MFLASPRVKYDNREIAAKDVVFVLDRTGSMSGEKFEQAISALRFCIRALNDRDRFNVIVFNEAPDKIFDKLMPADDKNVRRALDELDRVSAQGGTNIKDALTTAFKSSPSSGRPSFVLFLTDGLPTVGETDPAEIIRAAANAAPKNVRMFVFGVGYDVNTHLLDRLSDDHHGASVYVRPAEKIEAKVGDLFTMISNPVLTDVDVDFGGMGAYDVTPHSLPDVFKGSQIIVTGRFRHSGPTVVRLSGNAAGKPAEFKLRATADDRRQNPFVPTMWASRRIGDLLDEIRLKGENKELVEEVIRLSKRYGIVTEYTSFLVEEPESRIAMSAGAGAGAVPMDSYKKAEKKMAAARSMDTGNWAVSQAQNSQALKAVTGAPAPAQSYLDEEGKTVVVDKVRNTQSVAFYNDSGVWTDARYAKDMKVIRIKPYSEAQFALLRELPGLNAFFAQGERVLVVVGDIAVATDPAGADKLSDSDFAAIKTAAKK